MAYPWNSGDVLNASDLNAAIAGAGKFGGSGVDGALSIASGTTTLSAASAQVLIKNYSSISITGTGILAFSNPYAGGTYIVLKSSGNVTLTSSQTPMINHSNMGSAGGSGGAYSIGSGSTNQGTNGGASSTAETPFQLIGGGNTCNLGSSTTAASTYTANTYNVATASAQLIFQKYPFLSVAAGGGSGSAFRVAAAVLAGVLGAGGNGCGALVIECGGTFTFTTTNGLSIAGQVGGNTTATTNPGSNFSAGGGGGGGNGMLFVFYKTAGTITGTVNTTAAVGGSGTNTGAGVQAYGGSGGSSTQAASSANTGSYTGGTGASSTTYMIKQNTEY